MSKSRHVRYRFTVLLLCVFSLGASLGWAEGFSGAGAGIEIRSGNPSVYEPSFWLQTGLHGFSAFSETTSIFGDGYVKGSYFPLSSGLEGTFLAEGGISYRTDSFFFSGKPSFYAELSNSSPLPYIYTTGELYSALYFSGLSLYISPVFFFELDDVSTIGGTCVAGISTDVIRQAVLSFSAKGELAYEPSTGITSWYVGPEGKFSWYPAVPLILSSTTGVAWNRSSETAPLVSGGPAVATGDFFAVNEGLEFSLPIGRTFTIKTDIPFSAHFMNHGCVVDNVVMDQREIIIQMDPEASLSIDLGKHWQIVTSGSLTWKWSNTPTLRSLSSQISLEGFLNY